MVVETDKLMIQMWDKQLSGELDSDTHRCREIGKEFQVAHTYPWKIMVRELQRQQHVQ